MERVIGNSVWLSVSVAGACVGVALIVWALSAPVARGLMSGLVGTPEPRFSPMDIVAVGCVLMGLWWLKGAILPLGVLWLQAVSSSSEVGQSAQAWLGTRGKLIAAQDIAQIAVAAFFISRPYRIASWVLRHAPVVREPAPEPFDLLLRRARELGLRQLAGPEVVSHLTGLLALHPEVLDRLPELEALLRYAPNPQTRSAAARAIVEIGIGAAVRVKDTAAGQLAVEVVAEVMEDLKALVDLAEANTLAGSEPLAAS